VVRATGCYPYGTAIRESSPTEIVVDGRRLLMLGSNNYLGLTHHPHVIAAATEATGRFGTSLTGSRLLNGSLELHEELERRIAAFVGKPAALVFATGYQANLGAIGCLAGRGDVILSDRANHASIVDGCGLSFARTLAYRHNSVSDLQRLLAKIPAHQGRLVVTDGVFSMEGDVVDLPRLVGSATRHGARVMLDDAHGLGVLGPGGRGTAAHFQLTEHVDVITASFSKSLASVGGFVAGDAEVVEYVRHRARAFIFSASLPPASTTAALAALDVLQREPWRVDAVRDNAAYLKRRLAALGYGIGDTGSSIVPVITGEVMVTLRLWRALFDAGVFVNAAVPPSVPAGRCLLRVSCTAVHTREELDHAVDVFARVRHSHETSTVG
jgi:8-amino-7-oxononanoate synthase